MSRGRSGVGIEIAGTVLRGVVTDEDASDDVLRVSEVSVDSETDADALLDGFVRLHAQLDPEARPTRLAWFPPGATLQRLDVTGLDGPALNEVRHRLDRDHSVPATLLLDVGVRRWMVAIRWNADAAHRLQRLAEQAGFVEATIEPSPIAMHRALSRSVRTVRRDGSANSSWAGVYDDDLVVVATSMRAGQRDYPALSLGSVGLPARDQIVEEATLLADVASALSRNFHDPSGETAAADAASLGVQIGDRPFPPFPPHDLRAARRIGVAIGASLGAAGLFGRLRPVDVVTATRPIIESARRPWTLERLAEVEDRDERHLPNRWQRMTARFPRRPRRRRAN